jgi:hypothetical protein
MPELDVHGWHCDTDFCYHEELIPRPTAASLLLYQLALHLDKTRLEASIQAAWLTTRLKLSTMEVCSSRRYPLDNSHDIQTLGSPDKDDDHATVFFQKRVPSSERTNVAAAHAWKQIWPSHLIPKARASTKHALPLSMEESRIMSHKRTHAPQEKKRHIYKLEHRTSCDMETSQNSAGTARLMRSKLAKPVAETPNPSCSAASGLVRAVLESCLRKIV